jgi:hypothetical protein
VKKSIATDTKNYIDNLATEAPIAAAKGNMKDLYDITRKLSGKYKRHNIPKLTTVKRCRVFR